MGVNSGSGFIPPLGGGGGGGGATLTDTFVGFGSPSNLLTGVSDFTYVTATSVFSVGFSGDRVLIMDNGTPLYQFGSIDDSSILNGANVMLNAAPAAWKFQISDIDGLYFNVNTRVGAQIYQLGDISSVNNGTYLTVDDVAQDIYTQAQFSVHDGSNNTTAIMQSGGFSTSNGAGTVSLSMSTSGISSEIEYVNASGSLIITANLSSINTQSFQADSGLIALVKNIGGTVLTSSYGTTLNLAAVTIGAGVIYDQNFTGSTGASGVHLPTGTNAAIGAIVIVSDLDAIALTSNITIDAGTGNTINGATIAQTFVMATNGQCVVLKKVTATQWKLQSSSI